MRGIDEPALHEAALAHLARFAATEAGLRRVLMNRVRRWARAAAQGGHDAESVAASLAQAEAAVRRIAARLVAAGAVDDAAFAASRARRLAGSGRSRRATLAHLRAKGVAPEVASAALGGEEVPDEFRACLVACRRRRIGPFGPAEADADTRRRWMGTLVRAGFGGAVVGRALALSRAEAEDRLA